MRASVLLRERDGKLERSKVICVRFEDQGGVCLEVAFFEVRRSLSELLSGLIEAG